MTSYGTVPCAPSSSDQARETYTSVPQEDQTPQQPEGVPGARACGAPEPQQPRQPRMGPTVTFADSVRDAPGGRKALFLAIVPVILVVGLILMEIFASLTSPLGGRGSHAPGSWAGCVQHGICELRFAWVRLPPTSNPFVDVELRARFEQDASSLSVRGFYDGDDTFVVRFSPPLGPSSASCCGGRCRSQLSRPLPSSTRTSPGA